MIDYDPCNKRFKSIVGGVEENKELTISIVCDAQSASLVLQKEGEGHMPVYYPMTRTEKGFSVTLKITTCGLYFYWFCIDGVRFASDDMQSPIQGGHDYLQLVYRDDFRPLKGGVIYQIMPDRFCIGERAHIKEGKHFQSDWYAVPEYRPDENGEYNTEFFGGNLKGVIGKLDYLKELGVTYIYLNPIFQSPSSHRYDTSDYEKIDEALGSEKDFENLVSEARKRDMGIILDGVFSHTGADSKYFNRYGNYDSVGAYQSKESPYFSWYTFMHFPDLYKSWWGFETLPEVNETSPSYLEYMLGEGGIISKWEQKGIAGWRLDVADELPDEFLYELKKRSDCTVIGEVWENAARKYAYGARRRYFLGGQLDGVTNYPIRNAIIDFLRSGNNLSLRRTLRELINDYPQKAFLSMMNILGTHDTERILTALSCDEKPHDKAQKATYIQSDLSQATEKLKIASLIQFMLPGVPCIYYGDEAGLFGHEDPFCRKCYPWGRENKELIEHYKMLGRWRREYASALCGEFEDVSPNENVFAFRRKDEKSELTLLVNRSAKDIELVGKKLIYGEKILRSGRAAVFLRELQP